MSEKVAAVFVSVDSIVPWEKNPRLNDYAVAKVAESIREFGFGAPIVCRSADRMIIKGHTRWKAAQQLGLTEVPVRFLDISAEKARQLAIADNKLGELAGWDETLLKEAFAEIEAFKVDTTVPQVNTLELIGFDAPEVKRITSQVLDNGEKLLNYQPKPQTASREKFEAAEVKQIVLYLDGPKYDETLAKLQKLQEQHALTSNTEAVLFAIEQACADA